MREAFIPLSTFGIGSMPYVEGENACEKVFQRFDIPFWPQYPARTLREHFVFQFLSSFPGLEVLDEEVSFNEAVYERLRPNYRQKLSAALSGNSFLDFEPPADAALGYSQFKALLEENRFSGKRMLKLQVTGFNTVWQSFFSKHVSSKNRERVQGDLCDALAAAGLAQIQRVQSHGRTPFLVVDEPLPSAERGLELKKMIRLFKETGTWVGVHACSCGGWESFKDLGLDVFHFDLSGRVIPDSGQIGCLEIFLRKGTWIAWGVVPTSPKKVLKVQDFSPKILSWWSEFSRKIASPEGPKAQSLLAPSCGTGTLDPSQDEAVWRSLELTKKLLDSQKRKGILPS